MNLTLKKEKISFLLLSLLIRVSMDYVFVEYLSTKWAYQGFIVNTNSGKVFISYLIYLVFIFLLLMYQKNKISHFLVVVLFYTMYVPLGVIYGYMNMSTYFFSLATFSFFILIIILIYFNRDKHIEFKSIIKINSSLYWIILAITLVTFLVMTLQNFRNIDLLSVLNLADVYSVRENVNYGYGMNYLFNWQTKVINPYMIYYTHVSKKNTLKKVFIFHQLWMYILTGHKMVLFTLIVIFIIEKFLHRFEKLFIFFVGGFSSALLISIIEIYLIGSSYIVDFALRRILFVPALLNNIYYEFFSIHGFQYWKYTLIGRILNLETDFEVAPSFVIGEVYFNNPETNAVTGFLGSEYMNAGIAGILIATGVIIIVFLMMDSLSKKLSVEIVLITLLTPIYNLWNTSLTTALLTGGIAIGLILLYTTEVVQAKR